MYKICLAALATLIGMTTTTYAAPESLDHFLGQGRIREGLAACAKPENDGDRFSLAVLQVLDGLQKFSASMNELGIRRDSIQRNLPFFRLAGPVSNPTSSKPATPAQVRAMFGNLQDSLQLANRTLAGISATEEFKVQVNLSRVRLDFDGDGHCAAEETLVGSLGPILGFPGASQSGSDLVIGFDRADAAWLQGYTHFLSGVLDLFLAYDWMPVWNQCAHTLFLKPEPAPAIARFSNAGQFAQWADLIAGLHEMRLQMVDKARIGRVRDQFTAMIACSRTCWQRVLAETDNDHEWLPSPRQTGPAGTKITQVQVDGWMRVLDELEAIATGKKLLPHWRLLPGTGVNIDRLVSSPPSLDLVLLVQGSALIPYCEMGPVSDATTWRELTQPFGPGFFRFALWSN